MQRLKNNSSFCVFVYALNYAENLKPITLMSKNNNWNVSDKSAKLNNLPVIHE